MQVEEPDPAQVIEPGEPAEYPRQDGEQGFGATISEQDEPRDLTPQQERLMILSREILLGFMDAMGRSTQSDGASAGYMSKASHMQRMVGVSVVMARELLRDCGIDHGEKQP